MIFDLGGCRRWGWVGEATQNLMEDFEEAAHGGGIQSLALGALENSFLVGGSGVEVVKNFSDGIQGKGVYVKFDNGSSRFGSHFGHSVSTPKKALLMRAETNMLHMNSTTSEVSSRSTGLHQLDIETKRIVLEWKFKKEGTDITMRDITNNSKESQLDPLASTFLGLDDNRICRWDKRDRKYMIQNLANCICHYWWWFNVS
ncbi:hypothetical protein IFM89_020957 [Coptis chinensis]|uniref:Vacuolar import/degradation Vid27 C-terminal domain-containing protein n=1 Tax=Coptis chinensis TaxID=261450 RepID=A0A835M0X4_9MAGN|nr:hypothetical protein IFM89_020957 [Coptis chinensis]